MEVPSFSLSIGIGVGMFAILMDEERRWYLSGTLSEGLDGLLKANDAGDICDRCLGAGFDVSRVHGFMPIIEGNDEESAKLNIRHP